MVCGLPARTAAAVVPEGHLDPRQIELFEASLGHRIKLKDGSEDTAVKTVLEAWATKEVPAGVQALAAKLAPKSRLPRAREDRVKFLFSALKSHSS